MVHPGADLLCRNNFFLNTGAGVQIGHTQEKYFAGRVKPLLLNCLMPAKKVTSGLLHHTPAPEFLFGLSGCGFLLY